MNFITWTSYRSELTRWTQSGGTTHQKLIMSSLTRLFNCNSRSSKLQSSKDCVNIMIFPMINGIHWRESLRPMRSRSRRSRSKRNHFTQSQQSIPQSKMTFWNSFPFCRSNPTEPGIQTLNINKNRAIKKLEEVKKILPKSIENAFEKQKPQERLLFPF